MGTENLITAEGLAKLRAELEELETEGRARIAADIKTARGWGDLSENAEYHAAKNAQAHLETQIQRLRERLLSAQVVEETAGDVVGLGSTVEVTDEKGRNSTYRLVSTHEADPTSGLVSVDSPVGKALVGKRKGQRAVVQVPQGARTLTLTSVR
jgi:transcription elongation factor GreA